MSTSGEPSSSGPLQRGKACINCRKRKMKCDGARPICGPCLRGRRQEDCEYGDGQGRTRTEILEENIALLETRIKELEHPGEASASVTLHDPHATYRQTHPSSSASLGPGNLRLSRSPPALPMVNPSLMGGRDSGLSPTSGYSSGMHAGGRDPRTSPSFPSSSSPSLRGSSHHGRGRGAPPSGHHHASWWETQEPPSDVSRLLMSLFLPHASQFGWCLSTPRFLQSASSQVSTDRPLPALLSVIYLMGIHFSNSADLMAREPVFLSRAQHHLSVALSGDHPQKEMHTIQAEVILAYYFFRSGRFLEGRYHSTSAVSMAFACHLNKIRSEDGDDEHIGEGRGIGGILVTLPPSRNQIEEGERINAFWQTFVLDRVWSAVLGSPAFISNDETLMTEIDTPWPLEREGYEQGVLSPTRPRSSRTLTNFLTDTVSDNTIEGFSIMAVAVKSAVLFEQATQLAAKFKSTQNMSELNEIRTRLRNLDRLTDRFTPVLLPMSEDLVAPEVVRCVLLGHAFAQAAIIQLHSVFVRDDQNSRRKSLAAANSVVETLRKTNLDSIHFTNPIIGVCLLSN
ncbi:hypothetical protein JAAARDRAFT_45042 [Jaapia argillacea MUCL 33604]|uniref:Zn(2)-C6 fungal-type domain-containing protein n=1 Tax=Jaapia argillacea MUCL 33604 TaxID=933084 RepID=A0A067QFG4_9AGAM|nr:hypothetical protein JAAARDRAFT_45042 [Jaapia argillacea MUCL 33604]